jgi:predicted adenine nucleotide alpha hydrolase (AANH) superfamily ATPase
MSFETGRQVRLVQPVIQGEIIDTEYDKSRKELKHLIECGTRMARNSNAGFLNRNWRLLSNYDKSQQIY